MTNLCRFELPGRGLVSFDGVPRQPRTELSDGIFHVTARGMPEHPLFVDDHDRSRFVSLLRELAPQHGVRCRAYCVMGTHYHLLLDGSAVDLASLMKRLNGRYARRYNERHDRHGHVFAERYSAWVVRDERHLEQAYAYIDANPVKAGLCESGDRWPWTWIGDRDAGPEVVAARKAGTG